MASSTLFGISLTHYAISAIGAFVLYALLRTNGRTILRFIGHGSEDWRNRAYVQVADAILFVLVGSMVATIFTDPTTPQQALAAGLGWTGLLSPFGQGRTPRTGSSESGVSG